MNLFGCFVGKARLFKRISSEGTVTCAQFLMYIFMQPEGTRTWNRQSHELLTSSYIVLLSTIPRHAE